MRRPRTPYSEALRTGRVIVPFTATVVGRLPLSMAPLGMLLLVQAVHGSYSVAGLVTGAFALGTAVGGPWWGSTLDRQPHGRVVLWTSLASSLALATLALAVVGERQLALLLALAAAAGLTFPPFGPAMRETWRRAVDQDRLRSAGFALDAVAVETIFVAGPLLLSLFVIRTPAVVPLLVTAVLLVGGGLGYSITPVVRGQGTRRAPTGHGDRASDTLRNARPRRAPWSLLTAATAWRPRPRRRGGELGSGLDGSAPATWRTAGMLPVLTVAAAMSIGFGHIDTSLAATANRALGQPADLGWLFTAIAGGGAIGGLLYGLRRPPWQEHRRLPRLLAAFGLGLVPLPLLLRADNPPLWALMCALLLPGLCIAPTLIISQNVVDRLTHPHRVSEAQSWLSTAGTTGAAAGTAMAGVLVDHLGLSWSFGGAVAAAAAACLAAALGQPSWTAALRNGPARP
jgi:MFS family permease